MYEQIGYDKMMKSYKNTLSGFIGPVELFVSSNTLQVNDYDRYDRTMFDPKEKSAVRRFFRKNGKRHFVLVRKFLKEHYDHHNIF